MCEATEAERNLINLRNWKKTRVTTRKKQGKRGCRWRRWAGTRSCQDLCGMAMNLGIVRRAWEAFEKHNQSNDMIIFTFLKDCVGWYVNRENRIYR